MAPKRKEPQMDRKTLVGNGRTRSFASDFTQDEEPNMPTMHSTINADKFDDARFSEMRQLENETNPLRIIIFVVIVIAIGGLGVLFFRNLISNDQKSVDTTANNTTETDTDDTVKSTYIVDKTIIKDTQAVNAPKNETYDESSLVTIGDSTDTNADLSRILYSRFETFARLTFDFTAQDKNLPKSTLNFQSASNRLTLSFEGVSTISEGLRMDETISDIVKEIRYNIADSSYVIILNEESKYVAVKDGDNLVLNFKTVTELSKSSDDEATDTSTETPTTPATTPDTDTNKPTSNTFDNEYSMNQQYIVSSKTANDVGHNTYYFDNYVNSYEFSWAQKNSIGESTVPNAKAYYDTSAPTGKVYLVVEISNLSQEVLTANGVQELSVSDIQNKTGVNTGGSNLKSISLMSFSGGVAKYRLELNTKTEYKLWVDKTVDNTTGTISVTVKN